MIAEALSKNEGLKLVHFEAGRDRLENKGITALAKVFGQMGSLEIVHVPQNGIKDPGMSELLSNLQSPKEGTECPLKVLRVNDNWLKDESTEKLIALVFQARSLQELNISDCNMGCENMVGALRALRGSRLTGLTTFGCNYNDDKENLAHFKECLDILIKVMKIESDDGKTISKCQFIGNKEVNKSFMTQKKQEFEDEKIKLSLKEEDEDGEEDDDDDDDEDEDEMDEGEEVNQERLDKLDQIIAELEQSAQSKQ